MNSGRLSVEIWPVRVEELEAGEPFLGLQVDLAGEGVHVLDQRRHDLAQPRIGRLGERVDHVLRQPLLVVLGHLVSSIAGRRPSGPLGREA